MRNSCKKCKEQFIRYIEKKSYLPAKKRAKDKTHYHYGTAHHKYGVCPSYHYTRIAKIKINWDPCLRCKFDGVTTFKEIEKEPDEVSVTIDENSEIHTLRMDMEELKKEMQKYRDMYNEVQEFKNDVVKQVVKKNK